MKKRLVTSALPYVNNIPHLGNLIQVLSADVFSRFCRQYGYETLYVCGTDEYGTATETRALQEGITPRELCDRYHVIHKDIYQWFNIDFDHFGRTSTPRQTEIVQHLFHKIDEAGFIQPRTIEQLFCTSCDRFLADRFVHGICPHCGYDKARGDQCEDCGKLLDPMELEAPSCGTCGSTPEVRKTHHLYIDLPAVLPKLEAWLDEASVDGFWARNAIQMTKSWIRDGLKELAITRDLKWGIPVPKEGYEDKVFYVWFDAPIGYISITACLTDDWKEWWHNNDQVELFQFIGKDNIPFHTVIFPSTLLGSGEEWTMLHHMSSSEYLNYEDGKFSKTHGIGVFGNDCQDTGIPADVWRFYIFYNRPEKSDFQFTWQDFREKVNSELIGNLGNLVNRTLTFINRFYDGKLPDGEIDTKLWTLVQEREASITAHLDRAELRDGLREILQLADLGNREFQNREPWKARNENPSEAVSLLKTLTYLLRDLAILIRPYLPESADKLAGFLGQSDVSWSVLGTTDTVLTIGTPEILFKKLEEDQIAELRTRYSGSQSERAARDSKVSDSESEPDTTTPEGLYQKKISLKTARIKEVKNHPDADTLYVITLDCGAGADGEPEERTICSGLVKDYTIEELTGKTIVLAYNLKPAKLRGIKSQGMLLAAEDDDKNMEVLFPEAEPGLPVLLGGAEEYKIPTKKISINRFFEVPIRIEGNRMVVGETPLTVDGREIPAGSIQSGTVG